MLHARRIAPAFLMAIGACNEPTSVDRFVDVRLSTDREIVSPSTPAVITVVLANHGERTVETSDPRSYACMPPYSVQNEQGDDVPLPARFCALVAYAPVSLAPGATMTIRATWSAEKHDGQLKNSPVAPGQYRLAARVPVDRRILTSEPVLVSVTSPD
jgi:hypothetical protein